MNVREEFEILDLVPMPFIVKDLDDGFRYTQCNAAFENLMQRAQAEIIGHTDEEVFPPEVLAQIRALNDKLLATGESVDEEIVGPFHYETGFLRVRMRMHLRTGAGGHRCAICFLEDVTDDSRRVAAQAFKKGASSFLVTNLDHNAFRNYVADKLMDYFCSRHVLLIDADGQRRDWCREDESGQTVCQRCADCPMCTPELVRFDEEGLFRVNNVARCADITLPEGCPNRSIIAAEICFKGKALGRIGVFRTDRAQKFHEVDEQVIRYAADLLALSHQRSVSLAELVHKNNELMAERDRAIEAERAKSYFFSTVSHDIRTPLNAIIGFSQLLKLGIDDAVQRAQVIDSIIVSGKTLLQLINDVLDLSKLEAGRMEILPEPTNCQRLVEEIVESFRVANTNADVEIRGVCGFLPTLLIDAQRVRQILFNLVGNAIKFTKKGFVEVRVAYEREQKTLTFEVQDTGCGISEEDQQKIASPYVQVGPRGGRNGGTGLGLAICRQLVTAMNGELEMESVLGEGTTFYVVLNDVTYGDDLRQKRLSATQRIKVVLPTKLSKKNHRVLIVDDSPVNLQVLKAMLSRLGVKNVEMAENGRQALEKMKATPFDIVLTDMWMPEMDGGTFVQEVRKVEAWRALPVYALTADVEAQTSSYRSDFTGILLKPITLDVLQRLFA